MEQNLTLATTAIIGTFVTEHQKFIVFITSHGDINIPHIHIGDTRTFPECSEFHCIIALDKPHYIDSTIHQSLNPTQLREFIRFISNKDEDGDSIWRYTLKTWNMNNSNNRLALNTEIPDYTHLNN